jgi:predicted kinase
LGNTKLIIFSGLPAVGKSTLAATMVQALPAVHLRIDIIEQSMRDAGVPDPLDEKGYLVAYDQAVHLLQQGHTVIADSVNPIQITRDAWHNVAKRAGVDWIDVEIVCSQSTEHRLRVDNRVVDIPNLQLPSWEDIEGRDYQPWSTDRLVIDTAGRSINECAEQLLAELSR